MVRMLCYVKQYILLLLSQEKHYGHSAEYLMLKSLSYLFYFVIYIIICVDIMVKQTGGEGQVSKRQKKPKE